MNNSIENTDIQKEDDNIVENIIEIQEDEDEFDTIVLSGGSVKSLMQIGSLQYCYDNYLLKNLKTFIGTSAGAIILFLLIIGYTPIELMTHICTHHLLEKMQHFNI